MTEHTVWKTRVVVMPKQYDYLILLFWQCDYMTKIIIILLWHYDYMTIDYEDMNKYDVYIQNFS